MTNKQKSLFDYRKNAEDALNTLKNEGFNFLSDKFIWQILIYELDHFDIPTEIIHHNLSAKDIISYVKKHFESNGLPVSKITLQDPIVPEELGDEVNSLTKAEVKAIGEIWVIHKYDLDPFPSNPHAHNFQENCKIHLGNGELYRKKDLIGKIKKKDLITLREKITEQTNIDLPPYQY